MGIGGASTSKDKAVVNVDVYEAGPSAPRNVMNQGAGSLTLKNKLTALIVDDNRVNRLIHKTLLNHLGVKNRAVENGKEAVDLFCTGAVFDLILIDMEMPVMTGAETTRILRAMGVQSMIVGVTAYSLEREGRAFMEAGLDDFHEKPLTGAKLVSILQELDNR